MTTGESTAIATELHRLVAIGGRNQVLPRLPIPRDGPSANVPSFKLVLLYISTKYLLFIELVLVLSASGARARARARNRRAQRSHSDPTTIFHILLAFSHSRIPVASEHEHEYEQSRRS